MPNRTPTKTQSKETADELLLRLALTERRLSQSSQKLDARNLELSAIYRLSETIGSERQIDRLCASTADEIRRTLGAATVCILLLDEISGDLVTTASTSASRVSAYHPRLRPGDGLLWQVMKSGKPFWVSGQQADGTPTGIAVPIRTRGKTIGMIHVSGKLNGRAFSVRERYLLIGIANQTAVALDNATLFHDLENLFVGIAWSFAAALDAKSPWTAGHSKRVTQYSVAIAEGLGHDPEFLNSVQTCGLLHDIGKIGIPEKILDKTGAITLQERKAITEHAVKGAKILEHIDSFQPLLPGIRHHHERWDGQGFPDMLSADEIPMIARILAVADTYDAMTSDRPYRRKRNRVDAISEIEQCSGSQFDPQVVKAFIEVTSHKIF